jgi:hypothetical protein
VPLWANSMRKADHADPLAALLLRRSLHARNVKVNA